MSLETQALSLSWEDPLEKGMTTHSSLLAWRIPLTDEPGGLQSMELQLSTHTFKCQQNDPELPTQDLSVNSCQVRVRKLT